jgi:hypothetical protein
MHGLRHLDGGGAMTASSTFGIARLRAAIVALGAFLEGLVDRDRQLAGEVKPSDVQPGSAGGT